MHSPGGCSPIVEDYDDTDEEPLAAWEALLLPEWRWEAFAKADEGLYYGRVKSPKTYGDWEYGHFTQDQLEEAGAYRVDEPLDDNEPVFPDGGYPPEVYEVAIAALDGQYREDDTET